MTTRSQDQQHAGSLTVAPAPPRQVPADEFRDLADAAPVMIWVTDPQNQCVYINKEWCRFTGQSAAEAVGFGWIDPVHPDDRGPARTIFENAAQAREPFRLEYRLRDREGAYRWAIDAGAPRYDAQGTFLGYVGSVTDISVQKRAEAAARTGEERLHLALSAAEAGIWDWDLVTGRLFWAPETYDVLGCEQRDRPPTYADFEDSVHPDDRAPLYRAVQACLASDVPELRAEYRVQHPRRGTRWISSLGRVERSSAGTPLRIMGIILDVTERKRAEAETQALADQLTSVLESTTDGVFVLDRNWRFAYLNERAKSLIGKGRDLLQANVWESFPEAVGGPFEHTYRQAMQDGKPGQCEAYLPSLGAWFEANAFPTGTGLTVYFRDTTVQRESQQALRESEQRFRQFADNSRDVIWIVDARRRTMEYISPAFEAIWGRTRSWIKEEPGRWLETIHPDDRAAALAFNASLLETSQQVFEYRIVRPDGTVRWIRDSTFAIRDERGMLLRVGGIADDVTERREAEQRLKLLAAEVDHRAKNMLAVVQIMLRQTRADSARDYAAAALGRVAALARAHTLLSQTRWEGAWMRQLIAEELTPHSGRDAARVRCEGPDLALPPRTAQSFAMALHELATNAAKHGALSVPQGKVEIVWALDTDGSLALRWSETGGPCVSEPRRLGFGMNVVEQSIRQQLDGRVDYAWHPQGLTCHLRVPGASLVRVLRQA